MNSVNLNSYISYLQKNYSRDFIDVCLNKLIESDPSFIINSALNESEARNLISKDIDFFINGVKMNNVSSVTLNWIKDLSTKLLTSSNSYVIIKFYHIKRSALTQFLPKYTNDVNKIIQLVTEIDELFSVLDNTLIEFFEKENQKLKDDNKNSLENELEDCNTSLNTAESISNVGHCVIDYSRGTIKCSEGFYKIANIDSSEELTLDYLRSISSSTNGYVPFSVDPVQTFKNGKPNMHEFKIKRSENDTRILSTSDFPLTNELGDIIGYRSFIHDITKLKGTEELLVEGQNQMKKILDYSPTTIAIYDLEVDKLVYINWQGKTFLGYPIEKLMEVNFLSFLKSHIHPDDKDKITERIKSYSSLKDDEYTPLEYRLIDVDKNIKWVYSKAIVFKRENGKVKQVLFNGADISELKETEKELRYREEQLNEAQQIAHLGYYDWDIINDISTISEEQRRIYGFPPEKREMSINEFRNILKPGELVKLQNVISKLKKEEADTLETEYIILMPDKSEKNILSRAKAYRNSKGELIRVLGTVMDITSLKKVEKTIQKKNNELSHAYHELENTQKELKAINIELEDRVKNRTKELKEAKELYHSFIKQSSVGVWRFEFKDIPYIDTSLPADEQVELVLKHSYIAEANKHFANMFGIDSTEELIGHQFSDYLLTTDEQRHDVYKKGILSGYKLDDYEIVAKTIYGDTIYIQGSAIGIVNDNKFTGGWGIIRDVTDRRRAAEALKASEEQYRFLAETVPTIFWSSLPDGEMDYCNQRWYEFTGISPEESIAEGWEPFIHPDDLDHARKVWKESLETGNSYQIEYRIRRVDGNYRWHLERALPLKDKNGKIIKWMGTSTDIQEQKNFAEKLEQKNEELDNFIHSASHDLKNPVNNIEGLLNALSSVLNEENSDTEEVNSMLSMMAESIDKFRKNLLDLIEITKAQQRGEEITQDNNLNEVVDDIEIEIKEMIIESNAQINCDFKEGSIINFSPKNLHSIVYNLLSNAIKYRSKNRDPEILISTTRTTNYLILSVKDNGRGLDPDQVKQLFSQFKRFHSDVEGSGVGLYIIKRIITNAGGKVELESTKGKGSEFKVYFKLND